MLDEKNQSALGWNANDKNMPVILSGKTINYDASPAQINNTSIVERLWRNSHQGALLDAAYEGNAAWPTWIDPLRNPFALLYCGDPFTTIKSALEMTMPGHYLIQSYWSL